MNENTYFNEFTGMKFILNNHFDHYYPTKEEIDAIAITLVETLELTKQQKEKLQTLAFKMRVDTALAFYYQSNPERNITLEEYSLRTREEMIRLIFLMKDYDYFKYEDTVREHFKNGLSLEDISKVTGLTLEHTIGLIERIQAKEKEYEEGFEIGRKEGLALAMLDKGYPTEDIMELTGLTSEQIEMLGK